VPDTAPPSRLPNPSDPSNKYAKPPTDPKDLVKNGSNKDRLLGYMPHRPIMPGGFPDLGNAFGGFGSFRGLDWKLCNTSSANDKRPDQQKSAVASTIRSQKQDMDTQYGPDAPDRVKKCKIVSFGEESIGMLDAISDKTDGVLVKKGPLRVPC